MTGSETQGWSTALPPEIAALFQGVAKALEPVAAFLSGNFATLALLVGLYVFYVATRGFWARMWSLLVEAMFTNWQLGLLGVTGIVLSVASGWTTWDGMRNFTGEPVLSFLITFGIQGVMLIVAWLIGESFATGMHRRRSGSTYGRSSGAADPWLPVVGAALAAIAIVGGAIALVQIDRFPLSQEQMLFALVGLALVAFVGFLQADLVQPYLQSSRIVIRNMVLWVMFLACMTTSVFFSFDSLFSKILPAEERVRVAEIRAINQVAGVVADIGALAERRRIEEAERLFKDEKVWGVYEGELDKVAALARKAPAEIRAQLQKELEEQKGRVAALEENRANAESQQAGLQVRKQQLNEELSRLQAERPSAATLAIDQQNVIAEITRRLDEQRAKVLAEEKGVEGTGKVGRGQFWRAEKAAEERIKSELQVAEERLRAPKARVTEIDKRLSSIRAELAQTDGELAKLKGEAETARQMIAVAQGGTPDETASRFDPSVGVAALDRDRQSFRQDPKQETLAAIQSQCAALVTASLKVDSLRDEAAGIDCNPRAAIEAANAVFALNAGLAAFRANCEGGDKLPQSGGTDALISFGRKCLQDSGLTSKDSAAMGAAMAAIDLNRDDKAHRFVVTWNAFNDGNRLAYLALGIAIAIDSLIFMAGLFGANAVRSPLQDVPGDRARSARQLEDVIENALLPNSYENAHAVIDAMQPITPVDGFTQEVILPPVETVGRSAVRKVLNAGATIGAVVQDPMQPSRYLVRPELFEFLSVVAKKQFEQNSDNRRLAELKQLVGVALQPHVGDHAAIVLHNLSPINERDGFSSEVILNGLADVERPIVTRVLNAAATLNFVSQDDRRGEADRFYVHRDLYKTLAMIAAANPRRYEWEADARRALDRASGRGAHVGLPSPGAEHFGGRLNAPPPVALPADGKAGRRQLTGPAAHAPHEAPRRNNDGGARPGSDADASLADFFADRLFMALGFADPAVARQRLAAPGVREAAMEAWKALEDIRRNNRRLDILIKRYTTEKDRDFSEVYSELLSSLDGDGEGRDVLDRTEQAILDAMPVLMLFPEIGLVAYLTAEIEGAVSRDAVPSADDIDLLRRLERVAGLTAGRNLDGAETWQAVGAALVGDFDDEPGEDGRGGGSGDSLPNVFRLPRKGDGSAT
ncbi:MAG: hypothetical protein NW205_09700 [Hyphomicrobiaceae bacterium]|nr:hypothetical protein [Hyphomicrobiaceae bacterium]